MKKVEKLALAAVIVLLLCCIASFLVVFFSTSGTAFMNSVFQFKKASGDLRAIESRYPFQMSEGKAVAEERLQVFLEVCCEVKPAAGPVDEYRSHPEPGEHGEGVVFEGAPMNLSAPFLMAMAAALEEHHMGPNEWQWIANQMEFAKAGPSGTREMFELKRLREELERVSHNPDVPRHEKEHLKRQVRRLESSGPPSGPAAEADAALYARYADRLKACSIGERSRIILNNATPRVPDQEHIRVIVVNPLEQGPVPPVPPSPPTAPR